MDLKTAPLSLTEHTDTAITTALTFDDVLLVPQHSTVQPHAGRRVHAAHAQHPAERAAPERRHGHRHRVGAGHRDGAAWRSRCHSQEPADSRAGGRGRSRQAVGERDDRQPDYALAFQSDLRGARSDEELPDLRRAHHGRRQQGRAPGRHSHEPRPAVRDQRQSSDRRGDDEVDPLFTVPCGHDAR